jgi:hypothetical protein
VQATVLATVTTVRYPPSMRTWVVVATMGLGVTLGARATLAAPPETAALLQELGYSPGDIARIQAGEIVKGTAKSSSERELVSALAFVVKTSPSGLKDQAKRGLLDEIDPEVDAWGDLRGEGTASELAKLTLDAKRAEAYRTATAGSDMNLSASEIAALNALPAGNVAAVERQVRSALLGRVAAYRRLGLAGIPPYARAGGKERSAAEELRSATTAAQPLRTHAPAAYQLLLDYPQGKPRGLEEVIRWSSYTAHDTPTLALTHVFFVPEGDAWLVVQRQFYVSAGYNAEQAVVAFLPVPTGTLVTYINRTSTDQLEGLGSGMKRSLGSKIMASQLEGLFAKVRAAAERGK